jgi:hypothetical protein
MIKYVKWFWRHYRHHKRALMTLLTLSFVSSAFLVVRPILLKNIARMGVQAACLQ